MHNGHHIHTWLDGICIMGISIVDNRASGGSLQERATTTCKHCNMVIIYQSKYIDGFLRKVRTSLRADGARIEEIGEGFWCHKCNGDICKFCGEASTRTTRHRTMQSIADATGNAMSKGIYVWDARGNAYVMQRVDRKLY